MNTRVIDIVHSEQKQSVMQRKKCTKYQLLSLIGEPSLTYKAVPAGRIFLRRCLDLSMTAKYLHHNIHTPCKAKLD